MSIMMKRMTEQFDDRLMAQRSARKKAVLNHMLTCFQRDRASRMGLVYNVEAYVRYVRPRIRRAFAVPASMTLHAFADRVLIVAFGYARGEHGYVITLPTAAYSGRRRPEYEKDVCFAPENAFTVDIMHLSSQRGGHCVIDTSAVLLCDLLREPGDSLKLIYDLGDRIEHLVTLTGVQPADMSAPPRNQRVLLISGARAGIPENPGSVHDYIEKLDQIVSGAARPGTRVHRDLVHDWMHQSNWPLIGAKSRMDYDPAFFDAAAVQRRLDAAAAEVGQAHTELLRARCCTSLLSGVGWCFRLAAAITLAPAAL